MENYVLYMSLRSPFARRVRLVLEELKLSYTTEVIDVFNPPAWLFEINPLGRVPALRLPNGGVVIASYQIQEYLGARHANHPIFATGGVSEAGARNLAGLAAGVMDYSVQFFLERQRSPALQSAEALDEYL